MTSLAGKTVVITGGTGGIGLQAALALAAMDARLVLIGRDRARGEGAREWIRRIRPGVAVDVHYADLSHFDEVRRIAAALDASLDRIDVLVNNAGAIFNRRETTVDGLERTFALNHMSYFLLTGLLRGKLTRSAPSRIVSVASEAHRGARLDFDDLQGSSRYNAWKIYRRSKLCNVLFTRELARRLGGSGVTANCLHPGFVATAIGDNTTTGLFRRGVRFLKRHFALTPEQGARTSIYAVSAPELAGVTGGYFIDCRPAQPSPEAMDEKAARRLWEVSARLAGLDPSF